MRALPLLVLVPLAAAVAPATLATAGPGWAVFQVDVGWDWTLRLDVDARLEGDFAANGVLLLDAGTRPLYAAWLTLPLDGPWETRVRSSTLGLDARLDDRTHEGSYHSTITLACPGCRPRAMNVVSLVGGDVRNVSWGFAAPGGTVLTTDGGEGALALRQEGFAAPLDAGQSAAGFRAQAMADGRASLHVAGALTGLFTEDDALPGAIRVHGPDGRTRACPCAFPWDAAGPGAYAFHATQADVAGDLLLLVADARLPPLPSG